MDPGGLLSLLRGKYAPTEPEAEEVYRLLSDGRHELAQINDSILNVSLPLAALCSKKCQRIKSLAALSGVVSPIQRIPDEILGEIFICCCRKYPLEWQVINHGCARGAHLDSQVSSYWRAVCLSTRLLWNNVLLNTDSASGPPSVNCSHDLPLTIQFDATSDRDGRRPSISGDEGPLSTESMGVPSQVACSASS